VRAFRRAFLTFFSHQMPKISVNSKIANLKKKIFQSLTKQQTNTFDKEVDGFSFCLVAGFVDGRTWW
jgi:hypothetical protein